MNYCQACGKDNGLSRLRIPYIAQQGKAPLPSASESEGMGRGTGQRWEAIHICIPCAKKLGEKIKELREDS